MGDSRTRTRVCRVTDHCMFTLTNHWCFFCVRMLYDVHKSSATHLSKWTLTEHLQQLKVTRLCLLTKSCDICYFNFWHLRLVVLALHHIHYKMNAVYFSFNLLCTFATSDGALKCISIITITILHTDSKTRLLLRVFFPCFCHVNVPNYNQRHDAITLLLKMYQKTSKFNDITDNYQTIISIL